MTTANKVSKEVKQQRNQKERQWRRNRTIPSSMTQMPRLRQAVPGSFCRLQPHEQSVLHEQYKRHRATHFGTVKGDVRVGAVCAVRGRVTVPIQWKRLETDLDIMSARDAR